MAFFPEQEPKRDKQTTAWAERLYKALAPKYAGRSLKPSLVSGWANTFAKIRKDHGADKVEAVLTWYIANKDKAYTPWVSHAKSFQEKFRNLEKAMQREGKYELISPEVQAKAESIANWGSWPPEILSHLPALVQRTTDNWKEFCDKLVSLDCSGHERWTAFTAHVINVSAPVFIHNWFTLIHKRLAGKENYLGPPMTLAFTSTSDTFRDSFWRGLAWNWTGEWQAFDDLLEKLNASNP